MISCPCSYWPFLRQNARFTLHQSTKPKEDSNPALQKLPNATTVEPQSVWRLTTAVSLVDLKRMQSVQVVQWPWTRAWCFSNEAMPDLIRRNVIGLTHTRLLAVVLSFRQSKWLDRNETGRLGPYVGLYCKTADFGHPSVGRLSHANFRCVLCLWPEGTCLSPFCPSARAFVSEPPTSTSFLHAQLLIVPG